MRRSGVETMTRKTYPSDVTDTEWQIIKPLLPEAQEIGRPPRYCLHVNVSERVNHELWRNYEGNISCSTATTRNGV